MKRRESPLDLPLTGVRRIEASAGTGKTFTLALLHTRLVVERVLNVRQILAVTFTNAATQELRERLRLQLHRAATIAALDHDDRVALLSQDDVADRLTTAIIERRLGEEPASELATRLGRAAGDIDLASIFTIHGFCQRVLADHAVASGEPLLPREMLGSERELYDEVALDVWRRWTRRPAEADDLLSLWNAPDALAWDLPSLLRADELRPPMEGIDVDVDAEVAQAADSLREAWRTHGVDACAMVGSARASRVFNGNRLRSDTLDKLWAALEAFCATGASAHAPDIDKLGYLTPAGLLDRTNKGREHHVPTSPAFDAIEAFLVARARIARLLAQRRANLMHAVRDYARSRLVDLKRARNLLGFDDLIDGVHAALAGASGTMLAEALRLQYPAALVDEFQDTDPRQWQIFRRIYVDVPADREQGALTLFLIGDPKQAIYRFRGGDVHTYHAASRSAASEHALLQNFRSRPRVIDAVAGLFARGGAFPFADRTTTFPPVTPGGTSADADFVRAGSAAPALHLWHLPLPEGDTTRPTGSKPHVQIRVDAARRLGALAAAAEIASLLGDVGARVRDGAQARRVLPRDVAVLVNTHREAELVQAALAAHGVASVTAARSSLYASHEARETLHLLEALRASADDRRLRSALATELVGVDADGIDALSRDDAQLRAWLDQFEAWRERWERLGPLPMLGDRIAAAAPRLLAYADGERRLSNYLQLAEQLQEARSATVASAGLVDWLAQRIDEADERDETQQLRLEADSERVQIMTLHRAKGLEFACVFLPFAAIPPRDPSTRGLGLLDYHDGTRRVLHAGIADLDEVDYEKAKRLAAAETRAEQLRLLYVGLTRAKVALWLAHGAVNGVEKTALGWLLHRIDDDSVGPISDAAVEVALHDIASASAGAIVQEVFPDIRVRATVVDPSTTASEPALRPARRHLGQEWWVHSFSQLARQDSGDDDAVTDERGAADEGASVEAAEPSVFVGARFGNALHAALETVDFAAWLDWPHNVAPPAQAPLLARALAQVGYVGDDVLAEGSRTLATLIRHTLNVRLPEGARLALLARGARRDELEFHLAMREVSVPALFDLLHRHGLLRGRSRFGARERLEGLVTGFIDLVYVYEDRAYLLDYKSNRLGDYGAPALEAAVAASEYDLQYLLYTLALHRWLRFRRADYDYDRHFGGVRYLFCRGLDADRDDAHGVYATRPPRALIDALDALFEPPPGVRP